jgi:hypothetical protein
MVIGMPITLALFDMAATTVDDTIEGRPLVLQYCPQWPKCQLGSWHTAIWCTGPRLHTEAGSSACICSHKA